MVIVHVCCLWYSHSLQGHPNGLLVSFFQNKHLRYKMLIFPVTATCLVQCVRFGLINLVLGIYREVMHFVLLIV